MDRYENNSAYADEDRTFVHLVADEYELRDAEERIERKAGKKKEKQKDEEKPDIEYIPQGKGGYIRISPTSNFRMLPLFYALPKHLVRQRAAYLELPRNTKKLLASQKYIGMVRDDAFLELVMDCYAWAIWQFLKVPGRDGEYKSIPGSWENYSGYFPLWQMSYIIIGGFVEGLARELGWSIQYFFSQPYAVDAPWLTQKQFMNLAGNMTDKIVAEMNLQPTIDAVWQQRQPEDYNGKNVAARDHMRSWYHSRAFDHVSLESMMEGAGDGQGNPGQDIPDPDAEFEQRVIDQEQVNEFQSGLSETDMLILKMRMEGSTLEDIAKAAGYKTASAVKKRIDRIALQYEQFAG